MRPSGRLAFCAVVVVMGAYTAKPIRQLAGRFCFESNTFGARNTESMGIASLFGPRIGLGGLCSIGSVPF